MIEKLKDILGRYSEIDEDKITADTVILRDLGLNSYAIMEIITEIEDSFDIEIPDAILPEMKTVGDLLSYIERTA